MNQASLLDPVSKYGGLPRWADTLIITSKAPAGGSIFTEIYITGCVHYNRIAKLLNEGKLVPP